jgi:arylsulfatase A-like enzyme
MNRMCTMLIACMLLAGILAVPAETQAADRPNILFILTDDLGWGDLGCYGHTRIKTPHLDKLAAEGTQYLQFYVNNPVCSPSRTAFTTGHYPARHRVHGHFAGNQSNAKRDMPNWLDPTAHTLPRLLQQAGYATAHFGKWHLGSDEEAPPPDDYGFDSHHTQNSSGNNYDDKDKYFRAKSTGYFVDDTIEFIKANRDKPFYVNLWTLVPHATLHPTDEDMKPYKNLGPQGVPYKGAMQIFYATVTAMDRELGRLFAALDELGVADNTIIVFTSDNGPEDMHARNASHSGAGSPGPFRGRKRAIYEGGVRMPCIVRWPQGAPVGRIESDAVWTAVDLLPTMCKLAGVTVPADLQPDGEDVSDILTGASRPRTKPIMWEWRFNVNGWSWYKPPMLAMRDGDWKLLMNPDRSRVELYNIPVDPMEVNNQVLRYPDMVDRLAAQLLSWQQTLPPGYTDPNAGSNDYPWPGIER